MKLANSKNTREVILFYIAIIGAIAGAIWTLFLWVNDNQPKPSLKPHLKVHSKTYTHIKSIEIANDDTGPAVIKNAKFCRNTACTNNIVDPFKIQNIKYDTFTNLNRNSTIKNDTSKILAKVSESNTNSKNTLRDFEAQKAGISVHIEYTDIEGNMYGPLNIELK